ncbi:MAG: bacterial transcriptional activator domain-containing protein [Blautia marasmi]
MIKITPAFSLTLDTEQFLREEQNLSLYRGDFLEGFYLKNNISFNEWVTNNRQVFKAHYLKKLHCAISHHFDSGNYELCESLCQKQMLINEFDETAYKYLMQIYLSRKEYTQALHIYNRLESLLAGALRDPGKGNTGLALVIEQTWNEEVNKILEGRKELKAPKRISSVFYGRETELECIKKNLASLRQKIRYSTCCS